MNTKPYFGPTKRSRAYQAYLLRQTPERRAELMANEAAYDDLRASPGSIHTAAERDFAEVMAGGQPADVAEITAA